MHSRLTTVLLVAAALTAGCNQRPSSAENPGGRHDEAERVQTAVPTNTTLTVRLKQDVDTAKMKAGDEFDGEMAEAVIINGKVAIPVGAEVDGRIVNSQTAGSQGSSGFMTITLDSVEVNGKEYKVSTTPMNSANTPLKKDPSEMPTRTDVGVAADQAARNALLTKGSLIAFSLQQPLTLN